MPKRFLRILLAPLSPRACSRRGRLARRRAARLPPRVTSWTWGTGAAIVIPHPGGRCVLIDAGGGRRGGGRSSRC